MINSIGENSSDEDILKVDLVYPEALHKWHNDYPLTAEQLEISHDMLSKYCSNIANKCDVKTASVNKLVPN